MLFSSFFSYYRYWVVECGVVASQQGVPSARLVGKSQTDNGDGGGRGSEEDLSGLQHRWIPVERLQWRGVD
jgi:hypothetical protein